MRRLTFKYRGNQVELLSEQQVDMKLPARPKLDSKAKVAFWYELRDPAGRVVHRVDAADPIPTNTEVFSNDPAQSVRRVPYTPSEGVFVIVVPEVDDADEIALVRDTDDAAAGDDEAQPIRATKRTVELARFKLTGRR